MGESSIYQCHQATFLPDHNISSLQESHNRLEKEMSVIKQNLQDLLLALFEITNKLNADKNVVTSDPHFDMKIKGENPQNDMSELFRHSLEALRMVDESIISSSGKRKKSTSEG